MTFTNTEYYVRCIRAFDVEDFFKAKNKPLCPIKNRSRFTKILVVTTVCSFAFAVMLPDILSSDAVLKNRRFTLISQNPVALIMIAWGFTLMSLLITAIWFKYDMNRPSPYHSVKSELKTHPAWASLPPPLIVKILNGSRRELQYQVVGHLNSAQCDAVLKESVNDKEVQYILLRRFWWKSRNRFSEESLRKQEDAMLRDLLQQISTDNDYSENLDACTKTFGPYPYTSEKIITLYLTSKLDTKNLKNIHDFAAKNRFKDLVQACKDFLIKHQPQIACSVFFGPEKQDLLEGSRP